MFSKNTFGTRQGKSVIFEAERSQTQRIKPRVVFTVRGPGLYQGSRGTTCHKYAEAVVKHGFRPLAGDDASMVKRPPCKNQHEIVRLLASCRTIQIDFYRHWFVVPNTLELILPRANRKTFAHTPIHVCICFCGRPPKNYN